MNLELSLAVFWGPLTDVYEGPLKKTGGGIFDDLILPEVKQVEDAELFAERYKRYARPRAKRQTGRPQIRRATPRIHEPPVEGADGDAAPSEEDVARADAKHKHPPDRSRRQDNNNPEKIKLYDLRPRRPAAVV